MHLRYMIHFYEMLNQVHHIESNRRRNMLNWFFISNFISICLQMKLNPYNTILYKMHYIWHVDTVYGKQTGGNKFVCNLRRIPDQRERKRKKTVSHSGPNKSDKHDNYEYDFARGTSLVRCSPLPNPNKRVATSPLTGSQEETGLRSLLLEIKADIKSLDVRMSRIGQKVDTWKGDVDERLEKIKITLEQQVKTIEMLQPAQLDEQFAQQHRGVGKKLFQGGSNDQLFTPGGSGPAGPPLNMPLQQHNNFDFMRRKVDALENYSRRSNLIFRGIKEDKKESGKQVEDKVVAAVKRYLDFKPSSILKAHRIGKQGKSHRPVIAKFESEKEKNRDLFNRKDLKGSEIFVDEDFSREIRQKRFHLFREAKKSREEGNKAVVRYNKDMINDATFQWNEDQQCLEQKQHQELTGNQQSECLVMCHKTIKTGDVRAVKSVEGSMICWNVAGLNNKNREFWTFVRTSDIIILLETLIEEKNEKALLARLDSHFEWVTFPTVRVSRKGRAKGGQLIGIRKEKDIVGRSECWNRGLVIGLKPPGRTLELSQFIAAKD
uniref:Uncharacterized protein n=1 Tax=Strigamia maritima TaxID=126957 RepID=T1IJT2_STRMM